MRYCMVMLAGLFLLSACAELDITTPKGKKGETGDSGLSDYELWKTEVSAGRIDWNRDATALTDFFRFLKGKDGKDGVDGADGADGQSAFELWKEAVVAGKVTDPRNPGQSWPSTTVGLADFLYFLTGLTDEEVPAPHIDRTTGHWFIGSRDTGVPARGDKGERGDAAQPPIVSIIDGFWAVDGVRTDYPATPIDGGDGTSTDPLTVSISSKGTWILNGVDTGINARGTDGQSPQIGISTLTGNWVINGVDTGNPAFGIQGPKGDDGQDGKDAEIPWNNRNANNPPAIPK